MFGRSKKQQRKEFNELMRTAAYREAMDRFIAAHGLRQPTQPGLRAIEEIAIVTAHIVRVVAQRAGLDLRNLSHLEGLALGVVLCGTSDGIAQIIGEPGELPATVAGAEVLTASFGTQAADVLHEVVRTYADFAADVPPNEILVGLGLGAQRLLRSNDDDRFTALAGVIHWMVRRCQAAPTSQPTPPQAASYASTAPTPSAPPSPPSPTGSNSTPGLIGAALVGLSLMVVMLTHQNRSDRSHWSYRPAARSEPAPAVAERSPTTTLDDLALRPSGREETITPFTTTSPRALIPTDARAVATIAGNLAIELAESQQQLTLNGRRIALPESFFTLLSITRHDAQDIVLVSMNCGGTACGFLDLRFCGCSATDRRRSSGGRMRSSFDKHESQPGRIVLNESVPQWVRKELAQPGY